MTDFLLTVFACLVGSLIAQNLIAYVVRQRTDKAIRSLLVRVERDARKEQQERMPQA